MNSLSAPLPLFDIIDNLDVIDNKNRSLDQLKYPYAMDDFQHALNFLRSYNGSQATFNAYRREVERLLHWSWQITGKSVGTLRRADIENYLQFCQKPPQGWIGVKKVPRFIEKNGVRVPNSVTVFLLFAIPIIIGLLLPNWYMKRAKISTTLIKCVVWSNVLTWLIPPLGVFTGVSAIQFGN